MSRRIITLGDSTMQFNNFIKFPQTGWPQALQRFVKSDVQILNFAINGKSSKNYIELGLFENALSYIQTDDLVLIQFGHNDVKIQDPSRFTRPFVEYKNNLKFMLEACMNKGAKVILLTSISERYFENGVLLESAHYQYTEAMKELAFENNVRCIDMYTITKNMISRLGDENSKRLFMVFDAGVYENYPNGLFDNTHLRYDGAYMVAKCFYDEVIKIDEYKDLFLLKEDFV